MRLRSLHLSAYGRFTDRRLEFPAGGADLQIVFGPNEAGKSTALQAIGDLLHGIPGRSAYNFLHDYKDMRLAADIESADGARLSFQRRKGRQATLLDANGQALPDTALAPFLGAVDRAMFDRMFGLDHKRLQEGGAALLAAEGDVGRSLFEAGAAVADLNRVLRSLGAEAGEIFKFSGSKPTLNVALSRLDEVHKQVRDRALKADDWAALQSEKDALKARQQALDDKRSALGQEYTRLNRIRRLGPHVAKLDEARTDIQALAGVADLGEDAAARREEAEKRRAELATRLDGLAARIQTEQAALDLDPDTEALAARQQDVSRLGEGVGAILKAQRDLPRRRAELAQVEDSMRAILRDLGLPSTLATAGDLLPSRPHLATIRDLAVRWSGVDHSMRAARSAQADARAAAAATRARLSDLPAAPDAEPLRRACADLARLGDLRDGLAMRRDTLDADRRALDARLAALPQWRGDADALARLPLPPAETLGRAARALDDADAAVDAAERTLRGLTDTLAKLDALRQALAADGDLPTREAVTADRDHRDTGWRLIRRRFIDGAPPDAVAVQSFSGGQPLDEAYEQAVVAADRLADARADGTGRLARYEQAGLDAAETTADKAAAAGVFDQARRQAQDRAADWRALWEPAGLVPLDPPAMNRWLDDRAAICEAASRLAEQERALARDTARLDAAAKAVVNASAALGDAITDPDPVRLEQQAEDLIARTSAAASRRDKAADALEQAEAAEAAATRRLLGAESDMAAWTADWGRALRSLQRGEDTPIAEVEAMLDLLTRLGQLIEDRRTALHRIQAMEEDSAAFARDTAGLVAACAPDLANQPAAEAVRALDARTRTASERVNRRRDAMHAIAALEETRSKLETDHAAAEAELVRLMARAGVGDLDGLREAERRSAHKAAALAARKTLEEVIVADADGHSLAEVEAEVAGSDPDAVRVRLADLEDMMPGLTDEAHALGQTVADVETRERAMGGGVGAAEAAQDRESLLADIDALAERYIVLRLANQLLLRAIETYRRQNQGPLLKAAGAIFQTLTRGSFQAFKTDYGEDDRPCLLGLRADGAALPVEAMSEGTRDQLFLALRIAAVGHYVNTAGPVPFVADDLLVHFDDDRAAAAFRVLSDLARRTQVLFFTHNAHMVDIAQATLGVDGCCIHRL